MNAEVHEHLERAVELLQVARENLDHGHPADSVGRSYYAMYHAATAVLKNLGIERSSHHATWAAFGRHVAAEGLIEARHHRAGLDAFSARSFSDYLPRPKDTAEDARRALAAARDMVAACRAFSETP